MLGIVYNYFVKCCENCKAEFPRFCVFHRDELKKPYLLCMKCRHATYMTVEQEQKMYDTYYIKMPNY